MANVTASGPITIGLDPVIKALLIAELEIRSENDHVNWTPKRLVTEYLLRKLTPLTDDDEKRVAARYNGHQSTPVRGVEAKHKKQKVKPAAA